MALVNSLLLLALCLVNPNFGQNNPCPSGFKHRAQSVDKCYAIVTDQPLDWNAAQGKCRQMHPKAHLAVINSALENQVIGDILNNYDCKGTNGQNWFWTSGRRRYPAQCSSPFVWESDSRDYQAFSYTNFCPGEPDCGPTPQDCVTFVKDCWSKPGIYGWQNDICSFQFCPICELLVLEQP